MPENFSGESCPDCGKDFSQLRSAEKTSTAMGNNLDPELNWESFGWKSIFTGILWVLLMLAGLALVGLAVLYAACSLS